MTPKGGHVLLKDGKTKIPIHRRNGQVAIDGKAKLYKKDTGDMLEDLFTKPLDTQRRRLLLTRMNYASQKEGAT